MKILAIDPGTWYSGCVVYDSDLHVVDRCGKLPNAELLQELGKSWTGERLVVEMFANMGAGVGAEVFEAAVWLGRFIQAWTDRTGLQHSLVYRTVVKSMLSRTTQAWCSTEEADRIAATKSADSKVRSALIAMFPPVGGGKTPQVGTAKQPGPLYNVTADAWAALGVAITYCHLRAVAGDEGAFPHVKVCKRIEQKKDWCSASLRLQADV